jgi:phosphoserine phosphatase
MSAVLVVDLDGTLLRTDAAWESLLELVRRRPWRLLLLPVWLLRGRSYAKLRLAREASLDVRSLPYDEELLEWLKLERQRGRRLILATAAVAPIAHAVAQHLGIFDAVLCSGSEQNVRGTRKLQALQALLQGQPFEYVGNSPVDGPLWRAASAGACGRTALVGALGAAAGIAGTPFPSYGAHARCVGTAAGAPVGQECPGLHSAGVGASDGIGLVGTSRGSGACTLPVGIGTVCVERPAGFACRPSSSAQAVASDRIGAYPDMVGAAGHPVLLGVGWGIALYLREDFQLALLGYGVGSAAYSLWRRRLGAVDV